MALDQQSLPEKVPEARDYWPRYRKRSIVLVVVLQVILTVLVAGALIFAGLAFDIYMFVVLVAVLAASVSIGLVQFQILTEPFQSLINAIVHVSGEPTTTVPPNPNAKYYHRDGMKPLLETVYHLAASQDALPQNTAKDLMSTQDLVSRALDKTPNGLVIMNAQHEVVFASKNAPVVVDNLENKKLQLVFNDGITLDQWIAGRDNDITAEYTWHRIANKIIGEEDRRIFDIHASFDKGSPAEVILTFFEQTDVYAPEDESLDFVAFAAHELRGPITVIRGYIDVLEQDFAHQMTADQKLLFDRLTVSAGRLSGYVNNILNASRFDRRHFKIQLNEDHLSAVYDTIHDDLMLRASSQGRKLIVDIPNTLPSVAIDRVTISEVLSNLIDNGIKYSRDGGTVLVGARVEGDYVKVTIEDHGVGIPASVVGNLFQKFYRSHRSREAVSGTGIGLYICRAIVESHGGQIGVTSTEGQGSIFSFTVPIYATVADKLLASDNSNESLIKSRDGWIRNHSMMKG